MRRKKGNIKLFPLLIVILFIVISIGFIFNEKTNKATREETTIENEEKAVNKKEENDSATSDYELNAFTNVSLQSKGDISKEQEEKQQKTCNNQIEKLHITITFKRENKAGGKLKEATIECKPEKGAVKAISNKKTLTINITGENIKSATVTCNNDGKSDKATIKPKDDSKETDVSLGIEFYVPSDSEKEDGKAYCTKATWTSSYGLKDMGISENGYSLTQPAVTTVKSSITVEPISETSRDNPDEHVDGYKISDLYPSALAQINTTLSYKSITEDVPESVRRDSTTTNYEVTSENKDHLDSISYTYNEYNAAFEKMAGCTGDDCFKSEGKKKWNDHAYTYQFPQLEVTSADDIKPSKIPTSAEISLFCEDELSLSEIETIEKYNRQVSRKYDGNTATLTEYYYDDSNTTYFKGKQTFKYQVGSYIYNYGNEYAKEDAGYCLRTCSEVVKVDYGPPVFSRGGMCFEYRIKVSSIVNCESDTSNIKTPKCEHDVCLPIPKCYGYGGDGILDYVLHQGGPNEDYESCISECDGGKYTDKCSEKCYSEVYENSNNTVENQLGLTYEDKLYATQLASSGGMGIHIHHYYRTGGSVKFSSSATGASHVGNAWATFGEALGLWYAPSRANYTVKNGYTYTYMVNSNGIVRQPTCGDDCHWEGCESNTTYLDFDCNEHHDAAVTIKYQNAETGATDEVTVCTAKELVDKDCDYNNKRYEAAVDACLAATTCANSEAEYNIKFKYQEDGTKGTTSEIVEVNQFFDNKTSYNNKKSLDTIKPGTILSYGGCYGNPDGKRWYQTEWTTLGTWQENKHQYASYQEPSNKIGWTFYEGKICLSPYVHETNKAWANEYLYAYVNSKEPQFTNKFDNSQKYNDTKDVLEGYNIYASAGGDSDAQGFGYFGWKFNVSCFYAISNDNCTTTCCGEDCCEDDCCGSDCDTTAYTSRSFDDKNPIVNAAETRVILEDGAELASFENLPFNWSKDATMTFYAAGGYNNNPEDLLKEIIKNANAGQTFSQEQIDYEYIMDQQVINYIRNYNKAHKNYEFESSSPDPLVSLDTGIEYYQSKLLDELSGQTLKDGTKVETSNSKDRASMRAKNYRSTGTIG